MALLWAGCYSPQLTNFGFACDPQADKPCPDGYFCHNGYCDDGAGGTPPVSGTGGNGGDDMAVGGGGGGGGGGAGGGGGMGGGGGTGGGQDLAMAAPPDLAMPPAPDMARPPADMAQGSTCAHDECTSGSKLTKGCSACVTAVCNNDSYCCSTTWDSFCINDVNTYCTTKSCP